MEIKKSVSSVVETQKNRPLLFIFSIVLLVGLVASALYLSFAKTAIQDQQKQLDDQIVQLNTQIDQLKAQNVEGQQFAQQWLAQLEKSEIRWSKVIKTLQDLLPVDPLTQKPRVQFLSYSGSTGGKLTLNSQTPAGSADPFGDVSILLNVFNNSAYFKDAYIPSVSHGVSQTGQDLLSFVFNVTYEEQLPDVQPIGGNGAVSTGSTQQVSGNSVTTGSTSSTDNSSVKVPRNK
jgi:hypothetical protein